MPDLRPQFLADLDSARVESLVIALLILLVGVMVARALARSVRRLVARRSSEQQAMLVSRGIFYTLLFLVSFEALSTAGVDLKVLLGAAGILTVAIGFASQTSASNLISGIFLVAEQPFVLGDTIQVGTTVGEILSIDLLSVKIRTFDNLLLRIPNETLLKSEITNLTRFPIRRLDIPISLDYDQDLPAAQRVLEQAAQRNELCLDEPKPTFFMLSFGDSAILTRFSVWTSTAHFVELRTRFLIEIKAAFDAEGISFPFPQQTTSLREPLAVAWPTANDPAAGEEVEERSNGEGQDGQPQNEGPQNEGPQIDQRRPDREPVHEPGAQVLAARDPDDEEAISPDEPTVGRA